MKKNSIFFNYCLATAFLLLFNLNVSASLFPFTATYSGTQEVPPSGSPGSGTITGIYDDVTNTIFYRISFSGLLTGTVAGHLHAPAAAGSNANVIYPYVGFPVGVTSGTFTGSNVLTSIQEDQLKSGLVYSNIHTTGKPGGEIRAQITLGPASSTIYTFNRTYSGMQEVPPNNSTGSGTISGTYDPASNVIFYRIIFNSLQAGTVAGHLHAPGTIGQNASVIYPYVGFPTNVTSGMFTGTNIFTEIQEDYLLTNRVYSNIHTTLFPGGEIRAQIILDATPGVVCPPNITTTNDAGSCFALRSFAASTTGFPSPVVTYNVNNAFITSPFSFPVGSTTVTAVAVNSAGMASCNFTVTVNDTQAPVISGISATPNELWPPNNKMRDVRVNYTSSDNCSGVVSCALTVTSNEGGSGDWVIVDDHNVKLRAKRAGNGNGRIYTITATCRDAAGNATSASTIVTVPHDMGNKSDAKSGNAEEGLSVSVLSNPTTTSFRVNVNSTDKIGLMQLRLYNLSGVLVESKMNVRNNEALILGSTLRPGVYMLEVRQGQMVEKVKLVKQ